MTRNRQKGLRVLAAALVGSDLAPAAIGEILQALDTDPEYRSALRRGVQGLLESVDEATGRTKKPLLRDTLTNPIDPIQQPMLAALRRRRRSRADSIAMLRQNLDNPGAWRPSTNWKLHRIVTSFVSSASPQERKRAEAALGLRTNSAQDGEVAQDEFVEYLETRRTEGSTGDDRK